MFDCDLTDSSTGCGPFHGPDNTAGSPPAGPAPRGLPSTIKILEGPIEWATVNGVDPFGLCLLIAKWITDYADTALIGGLGLKNGSLTSGSPGSRPLDFLTPVKKNSQLITYSSLVQLFTDAPKLISLGYLGAAQHRGTSGTPTKTFHTFHTDTSLCKKPFPTNIYPKLQPQAGSNLFGNLNPGYVDASDYSYHMPAFRLGFHIPGSSAQTISCSGDVDVCDPTWDGGVQSVFMRGDLQQWRCSGQAGSLPANPYDDPYEGRTPTSPGELDCTCCTGDVIASLYGPTIGNYVQQCGTGSNGAYSTRRSFCRFAVGTARFRQNLNALESPATDFNGYVDPNLVKYFEYSGDPNDGATIPALPLGNKGIRYPGKAYGAYWAHILANGAGAPSSTSTFGSASVSLFSSREYVALQQPRRCRRFPCWIWTGTWGRVYSTP